MPDRARVPIGRWRPALLRDSGFASWVWKQGDVGCFLVSDMVSADDVERFKEYFVRIRVATEPVPAYYVTLVQSRGAGHVSGARRGGSPGNREAAGHSNPAVAGLRAHGGATRRCVTGTSSRGPLLGHAPLTAREPPPNF